MKVPRLKPEDWFFVQKIPHYFMTISFLDFRFLIYYVLHRRAKEVPRAGFRRIDNNESMGVGVLVADLELPCQSEKTIVNKVRTERIFIDKKPKWVKHVLPEEKLDDVAYFPSKSWRQLSEQTGISKTSAFTVTKLLKFKKFPKTCLE